MSNDNGFDGLSTYSSIYRILDSILVVLLWLALPQSICNAGACARQLRYRSLWQPGSQGFGYGRYLRSGLELCPVSLLGPELENVYREGFGGRTALLPNYEVRPIAYGTQLVGNMFHIFSVHRLDAGRLGWVHSDVGMPQTRTMYCSSLESGLITVADGPVVFYSKTRYKGCRGKNE
ncbi:hypothetical protein EV426DRAFT_640580 [Tirmania nivea]|nr:hypothetical protein EV426DRAFT_640580 [Tirmania nivea]